jgi:hypothetical protein
MPAVIGCDAHKQFSVFVAIDSMGKTAAPVRVEHHRQEYIDFLHTLPPASEIALEATGHWYWMVDEMEKAGHRPHLANPTEAKKRMGRRKQERDFSPSGRTPYGLAKSRLRKENTTKQAHLTSRAFIHDVSPYSRSEAACSFFRSQRLSSEAFSDAARPASEETALRGIDGGSSCF